MFALIKKIYIYLVSGSYGSHFVLSDNPRANLCDKNNVATSRRLLIRSFPCDLTL